MLNRLKNLQIFIVLAVFCSVSPYVFAGYKNKSHLNLWAFAGSYSLGRGDFLLPLADGTNALSYFDLQGEVGVDNEWYAGVGGGYRRIINNRIYGGYLFLDDNRSSEHHSFWVLNPGFEMLSCPYDFRINAYIPVGDKTQKSAPFFRSAPGCVDLVPNDIEFTDHQEFQHRFVNIEEVGPGADFEVGHRFYNGVGVYAGAYAFHFDNADNIRGVEGRFEFPLRGNMSLATEVSYDNYERARFVTGIRVQFDKPVRASFPTSCSVYNRMYEPVIRNIGSVGHGSGVPILKKTINHDKFLIHDHIYFFTTNGGVPFAGDNTGTYENPLAADQFNQTIVNGIAGLTSNANLFLSPGSYTITPNQPNGRIAFPNGQSVYGRSVDYRRSAFGDERAQVIGGFDLLAGNNTISSIRLFDQIINNTGTGANLIAVSIQNAPNIHLCNDDINATVRETGVLTGENLATAINANNSEIVIDSSTIGANVLASAANSGALAVNASTGIGGIVASTSTGNPSSNNKVTINSSTISSLSQIDSNTVNSLNFSAGIGTIDAPSPNSALNNAFNNNIYNINNSMITATASSGAMNESDNQAVGVGALAGHISGGLNTFNNNTLTFTSSTINAQSLLPALANLNSVNVSVGVGGGSGFNGNNQVNANNLIFNSTNIQTSSTVLEGQANGDPFINRSIGIGVDAFASGSSTFSNNTIQANSSNNISATATLGIGQSNNPTQNFAVGIGSTVFGGASAAFNGNTFTGNAIAIKALAEITNSQSVVGSINEAIGVGIENSIPNNTFDNNNFAITQSTLDVKALIQGNNAATNKGLGLFAGNGTVINFLNSTGSIAALVNGTNTGTNTALATQTVGTGVIDSTGSTFTLTQIP